MKNIIVLAMHGIPPKDFPHDEMMELFKLHEGLHHAPDAQREQIQARYNMLDEKMRSWQRTEENDPFFFASQEIATNLSNALECDVIVGFNEFCGPSLDEALDRAAASAPQAYGSPATPDPRGQQPWR